MKDTLGYGVFLASNRREDQTQGRKKKFLKSRAWPEHKADNFTAMCEPVV
jgi:hypothetical protein